MKQKPKAVIPISEEERARRQNAVDYGRRSNELEGFYGSKEAEALDERYVAGELTSEEHSAAVRRLYGF